MAGEEDCNKSSDAGQEKITGVALRSKRTGLVLISLCKPFRHGHLFMAIKEASAHVDYAFREEMKDWDEIKYAEQGFVTDRGRFLDRVEALNLAKDQGLISENKVCPSILFSEDLW